MRVLIVALGSRGDVQPFVALGRALQHRGHQVRVYAEQEFGDLIRIYGLEAHTFDGQMRHHMAKLVQVGHRNAFVQWWRITRSGAPLAQRVFRHIHDLAADADVLVFSWLGLGAQDIAVARGIVGITAAVQPLTPTRAFAHPLVPAWNGPGRSLYNRWSYWLGNGALSLLAMPHINRIRRELLGLPPRPWRDYWSNDPFPRPILYGISPHMLPRPADWDSDVHLTGPWLLPPPPGWTPPPRLQAFLEAGPPPVYVGFGSMVDPDPVGLTRMVIAALRAVGRRGILLGGWAHLGHGESLPDDMLVVHDVPHTWLFPRCAAVVHHGGAGTTAAAMTAGVPAVVVPYLMDQPFWGRLVAQRGVGPAPIPRRKLTTEALIHALRQALDDSALRERAAALGQTLRAENGPEQAAQWVETWVARGPTS